MDSPFEMPSHSLMLTPNRILKAARGHCQWSVPQTARRLFGPRLGGKNGLGSVEVKVYSEKP